MIVIDIDMPEYTVLIPSYGQPNVKNGIIYIPLNYLEKHFALYSINKETVFQHILEHEKLHIANGDSEYREHTIKTIRGFKKYARYLRKVETEALPILRFDKDEDYSRLNEICLRDLEARIESYLEKFLKYRKLNLVTMSLTS